MKTIETVTDIAAPPDIVWGVLADFPRYPEWNPFIVELRGEPLTGTRLRTTFALAGQRTRTFRPTVIDVQPGHRLMWHGRLAMPKLFDAKHRFVLEPNDDGTRFTHREEFRGLLVPVSGKTLAATHRAFLAMNAALAARAEAIATELRST
jgi:hypothetical protein